MDAWGLANIIHACYYVDCKCTMQQLLPVFLQPRVLDSTKTQNIANVVWAIAKAGLVLQDNQLQQLLGRLLAKLHEAKLRDIANFTYAVAAMGKQLSTPQLQQLMCVFLRQNQTCQLTRCGQYPVGCGRHGTAVVW